MAKGHLPRGPKGPPRWRKATSQGQISSSINLRGGDSMSFTSPNINLYLEDIKCFRRSKHQELKIYLEVRENFDIQDKKVKVWQRK